MKKISVILGCVVVLQAIIFVGYIKIKSSRSGEYRTMGGTLTSQDTEYRFSAAVSTVFQEEVARMSEILDDSAIDYMIHDPEIVELWIAEKDVARFKRLFRTDTRGFILVDRSTSVVSCK